MKVAGFGFRQGASAFSLHQALVATGVRDVTLFATVAQKADAPCLTELAGQFDLDIQRVEQEALPSVTVVTQSEKSEGLFGTGSLSEATALIAAGPGARLIATRAISPDRMATCAIAEGEGP